MISLGRNASSMSNKSGLILSIVKLKPMFKQHVNLMIWTFDNVMHRIWVIFYELQSRWLLNWLSPFHCKALSWFPCSEANCSSWVLTQESLTLLHANKKRPRPAPLSLTNLKVKWSNFLQIFNILDIFCNEADCFELFLVRNTGDSFFVSMLIWQLS